MAPHISNLECENDSDGLITEINVTPMVDIMLVLLIIFMVTANLIIKPSISVELPKASKADHSPRSSLGITIKADGKVLLNGKEVTEKILFDSLKRRVRVKKESLAIIAGDAKVPHGRVVHVIDIIRRAGISKFAINIKLEEKAFSD